MTTLVRQKIFEIAEELLREGTRPTQQLVRERMGSGSLTTINRALNEWWASLSQRLDQRTEGFDLPEPVIRLSNRLWTESLAYARREYDVRRQEAVEANNRLQDELNKTRSEHSEQLKELNTLINALRQQNTELEAAATELKTALSKSEDECFRLSREQNRILTQGSNEELLEARVRLQLQQEQIETLNDKNQTLISENAELRLKLKQR